MRPLLPVGLALGWLAGEAFGQQGVDVRALQGPSAPGPPGQLQVAPAAPAPAALPFPISPDAGEWVICAASYSGPDAPELARQVALVLRDRHRLPAYTFNHADEQRQQYEEEYKRLKARYPGVPIKRRTVRLQEHCAVLIGGFKDMDSASLALEQVRALPLPELKLGGDKTPYAMMSTLVPDPEHKDRMKVKREPVNPFSTAMVVRNPTVPRQPRQKAQFDPFLEKLNAEEEFNLLKSPKPWTLLVKEYTCSAVVPRETAASTFLQMLGLGKVKPADVLGAGALQAHELAKVLRSRNFGFTAYVLHTRNGSAVTVGEFDGPEDPALAQAQARLASMRVWSPQLQGDPLGLLPTPIPVQVPRP